MERSHSIFCTNRHKIEITTVRSLVGLNTSIQEKTMEFSMLQRHLIFMFVYWYNRQVQQAGTIIADDNYYLCTELVCTSTTTYLYEIDMD